MAWCRVHSTSTNGVSLAALAAAMAFVSSAASAQEAGVSGSATTSTAVEAGSRSEILVTAQRREQSLQDVPVAITAVSSETVERLGIARIDGLQQVAPNLQVKSVYGSTRPSIFLRGVGFDAFSQLDGNSVSVNQDDVVIEAKAAQLAQFFDVERVEVLRGPQGTLYGRNSTGGAINIFAVQPTFETTGYASVQYGNYDAIQLDGALTTQIVEDKLAVRVSGTYLHSDGYYQNVERGNDVENDNRWAARAIFLLEPSDNQKWTLNLNTSRSSNRGGSFFLNGTEPGGSDFFGNVNPDNYYSLANDAETFERVRTYGASLRGVIDIGDVQLTTVTAYIREEGAILEDSDASPADLFSVLTTSESDQFTQELRLAGETDRLNWILGGFFFHQQLDGEDQFFTNFSLFSSSFVPETPVSTFRQRSRSYAVFGQLDYELLPRLTATLGIRYTHDEKRFSQEVVHPVGQLASSFVIPPVTRKFDEPSYRIGLQYEISDDFLAYASFNRGYRAGQPSGGAFGGPAEFAFVNPEFNDAYEIGIKSEFLDRRVRLNVAAFYNDLSELQVQQFVPVGVLNVLRLQNAASAETYGIEADLLVEPVDDLLLSFSTSLLEAQYKSFTLDGVDLKGEDLVNAPTFSMSASAQYSFEVFGGELTSAADYSYRSSQLLIVDATDEFVRSDGSIIDYREPGYGELNLSLAFEPGAGNVRITGYVRNLLEEKYRTALINVGDLGVFEERRNRPRTYGVGLRYRF